MILFASCRPLERAENIKAVWDAYDGEKDFIQMDGKRNNDELAGDYDLLVTDEFVTKGSGKCIMLGHGIAGGKTYGLDQPDPYHNMNDAKLLTLVVTSSRYVLGMVAKKCGVAIGPWWLFEYPLGSAVGNGHDWIAAEIPLAEGKNVVVDRQQVEFYYVVNKNCKNPEALMKMINMYIELDGQPEAEPEQGYVWSWCPTQFYDPYDINEQYLKINEQLVADPTAKGEAPAEWTPHMKKIWAAYPEYLIWLDDSFATKYQENMFANIMARVNKDGAWAQIVSIYDNKKRVSYDEFFGVTTPSMSTKGSIMSQEVEEYYLKAIMGEKNIDQTWDSFVSTWYKIGGTEVVNEINQWYLSEGYKG